MSNKPTTTFEEAVVLLNQYLYQKQRIEILKLRLEELGKKAQGNTGCDFTKTIIQGGEHKGLKDFVNEELDLEQKFNEDYNNLLKKANAIEKTCDLLALVKPKLAMRILMRYIENKSINFMAEVDGISYDTEKKRINEAISEFAKLYKE